MATESDNVNTGALGTIAAVGALAVLGIALAVTALVRSEVEQEAQVKGVTSNARAFHELEKSQQEKLGGIEQAMDQTVKMLEANPWSATPAPEEKDAGSDAAAVAADAAAGDAATEGEGDAASEETKGEPATDTPDEPEPKDEKAAPPQEKPAPADEKKGAPPTPPDGEDAP